MDKDSVLTAFRELQEMIPVPVQVETSRSSQTIDGAPDIHKLILVTNGHLSIAAKAGEPAVIAQGFACHPRNGPFEIHAPKTKETEYAVISYRVFPAGSPWSLNGPLRTLSEVKIKYMLDELIRTLCEVHPHSAEEEEAQHVRKRLIMERLLFIFIYETYLLDNKKSSAAAMEETLSYMNEHYMLKLTLPMLARRAGMSEGHFTVLFKKCTGMTMTRYLRRLRIEKAKQMFMQTGLSAKEIAQRTGFADYFHFSRIFKAEVGCSPTAFRKSVKNMPQIEK